jgi:hypothetical protein
MREIKFRARVFDDELGRHKMVYPTRITLFPDAVYVYVPEDDYEYQIKPEFLLQFTGLRDRRGVEIYEGDILAREYFAHWVVCWGAGAFHIHNTTAPDRTYPLIQTFDREVIGNIHENADLLKERTEGE